jgi:hypothetical protein
MATTVADLPGRWTYLRKPPLRLTAQGDGYQSSLAFETDFSNLSNFILTVGGTANTITATWGSLSRITPLQHPLFPSLLAFEVDAEACGEASTTSSTLANMWSRVRLNINFRSVPYDQTGDQAYMTIEEDVGSTYTTFPGRKLAFTDGEPIDQDAGTFVGTKNYQVTVYQAPSLDSSVTDALIGKINNATFLGFAAESLLFGGVRSSYERSVGGLVRYQKTFTFAYQSHSWNQAYKKNGTLGTVVDPAGNNLYSTGNFYLLMA